MKRYELTKEQWERVKAILPPERTGQRVRPRKDDRKMLNGMLWTARSGAQWRELPEVYDPWQSVYARFAKWRDDGTLETIFHALSKDADIVDGLGKPVEFMLSAGNDHDSVHAVELLEKVTITGRIYWRIVLMGERISELTSQSKEPAM